MSFRIGLTGSIGMGKSTTARMFAEEGVLVWDADAAVARLYGRDGAAVGPVAKAFPGALRDGAIDRAQLSRLLEAEPARLAELEGIVHPLVAADRQSFADAHETEETLYDIPLLFEIGADDWVDHVVVVSVDAETQKARVMARDGMTEKKFRYIMSQQMPDAEKRARADTVIETYDPVETRAAVRALLDRLRGGSHA